MIEWHRLFGLTLMDFFSDSYYEVELEKDMTIQEQSLDIVILRKSSGKTPPPLPDGLDNLSVYNLLSYKSLREPLDGWVLDELVGYYTIYRKQISPSLKKLLPIEQFQLYAVCTRSPHFLSHELKQKTVNQLGPGIYDLKSSGSRRPIRIIVLGEITPAQKNALWQLFSGQKNGFDFGDKHYQWHNPKSRQLLNQLYQLYQTEGVIMPYTLEDYYREYTIPFIESLPPEIRLTGLGAEERLKGLPAEEVFKPFSAEERLKGLLPEEVFKPFSAEERLNGLSPKVIEEYLSKIKSSK
jgi:hypothetical protein